MSSLLLLSSSLVHGHSFLGHAREAFAEHLSGVGRLVFVPYARADQDDYTARVAEALTGICQVTGAHRLTPGQLAGAEAYFIGGGNTFRLLKRLQRDGSLDGIRDRVRAGAPYAGASAGTNLAAPTIRTTNDMPIVEPDSLEAFGFVPFQINPHYLDAPESSTHKGETRETRLREFLEDNDVPVVALRENTWLRVRDGETVVGGVDGAAYVRVLRRGHEPQELELGASVTERLGGTTYQYG